MLSYKSCQENILLLYTIAGKSIRLVTERPVVVLHQLGQKCFFITNILDTASLQFVKFTILVYDYDKQ